MTLKLVLFDVDGTLIDSQAQILQAMTQAFKEAGLTPPERSAVQGIIGLSLHNAIARLAPELTGTQVDWLVDRYKAAYVAQRVSGGGEASSPPYPGALETLKVLAAQDDVLLGVATGKSRRGLNHLFDAYGLASFFVTVQVADDHPSKPHPSMVFSALSETGVDPADAVLLGDTSYDMEMACAGGIRALGVTWGYHAGEALLQAGAEQLLDAYDDVLPALDRMWLKT